MVFASNDNLPDKNTIVYRLYAKHITHIYDAYNMRSQRLEYLLSQR